MTAARPMHNRTRPDDERVERDGGRTKLRLEQLEPPLDIALRVLQFTCGKRHRPVMMGRLENENRIGVAIDEIPDLLLSFAGSAFKLPPT